MRKPLKKSSKRGRRVTKQGVTVEQLADILGIGRNQAYDAVRSGTIPALRIGRCWWISPATVEAIKNGTLINNTGTPLAAA